MQLRCFLRHLLRHRLAGCALASLIAFPTLGVAAGAGDTNPATVTFRDGTLHGALVDGVQSFLGIPYAAPPIGALRWQPPQRPAPRADARDATQYGAACVQGEDRLFGLTPKRRSEDCLYLNVWAPPHPSGPLPVMVWLHGGAHRIGTAALPTYDGRRLASRGVIVVTLNYRLGYLGYFAWPGLAGGNFGLMDQIAALHWVQDNIAAFGGDPKQVTVFGESAGGADVLYLMTSPAGRGLFRAAIVESGGGWGVPKKPEAMQKTTRDALATIDIDKHATLAQLRALDANRLIEAQSGDHDLGFGPFLDGKTVFESPASVFAAGRQMKVPLIIGSNDNEGSLLKFRKPRWRDRLLAMWPTFAGWYEGQADNAEARIPLLFRDIVFGAPARWVAAHQPPTWLYRFSYVTSGQRAKLRGAGHAAELSYVFDTVDALQAYGVKVDDEDRQLATRVADCWASFARQAAPQCSYAWQPYSANTDNALLIDRAPHEAKLPDGDALDGVTHYFGPGGRFGS